MRKLVVIFSLMAGIGCASVSKGKAFETGMASWYGQNLGGHKTASGERFDPNELTAAHRTLPFGTRVYVRSLTTGKSVLVRINDRGPYAKHRVIDLSYAAARRLGLTAKGEDRVELVRAD